MLLPSTLQGHQFGSAQLTEIQSLQSQHPEWSRYKLSRQLALLWNWRTAGGQLRPLIERTRRAIERGDFIAAERTLGEAERIDANAPEVIEVRRELRAAERQGNRQQDGRVTILLTAARAAMHALETTTCGT